MKHCARKNGPTGQCVSACNKNKEQNQGEIETVKKEDRPLAFQMQIISQKIAETVASSYFAEIFGHMIQINKDPCREMEG